MDQYSPSRTSGKTAISEWDNILRYPKYKDIPSVVYKKKVKKGFVYVRNENHIIYDMVVTLSFHFGASKKPEQTTPFRVW